MPRKMLAHAIKDFNDVILFATIAQSDVLAKLILLQSEGLYKATKSDGYIQIRKKFKELAEPLGFKAINIEVVEIIDTSSRHLKGVKLYGENKRPHKRTKSKSGNPQKRSGRRARETTTNIQ